MSSSSEDKANPVAAQYASGLRVLLRLPPLTTEGEEMEDDETSRHSAESYSPNEEIDYSSSSEVEVSSDESDDAGGPKGDVDERDKKWFVPTDANRPFSAKAQRYWSAKRRIVTLRSKLTPEQFSYCADEFERWEDDADFPDDSISEYCETLAEALEFWNAQTDKRRVAMEAAQQVLSRGTGRLSSELLEDLRVQVANSECLTVRVCGSPEEYRKSLEESLRTLEAFLEVSRLGESILSSVLLPVDKETETWSCEKCVLICQLACESSASNLVEYLASHLNSPQRIESFVRRSRMSDRPRAIELLAKLKPASEDCRETLFSALLGDVPDTIFLRKNSFDGEWIKPKPNLACVGCALQHKPLDDCPELLLTSESFAAFLLDSPELQKWLASVNLPKLQKVEEFAATLLSCAKPERAPALLKQLKCLLQSNADCRPVVCKAVQTFVLERAKMDSIDLGTSDFEEFRTWCLQPAGLDLGHSLLTKARKTLTEDCRREDWRDAKVAANQITTLLKWGANPNAFRNNGIATAGDSRSMLHQLLEHQSKLTPSTPRSGKELIRLGAFETSLGELIQELQRQGCDIIPYDQIKRSKLVLKVKDLLSNGGEQPVLYFGFEAMRTPYVEATKEGADTDSRSSQDALRMWDIWEFARNIQESDIEVAMNLEGLENACKSVVSRCTGADWRDVPKCVIAQPLEMGCRVKPGMNKCSRAAQYLDFLGRKKAALKAHSSVPDVKLFPTSIESNDMNVTFGSRGSTRRCKLGLDWVCEQKGHIASLLDGVDFDEILRYDDRKLAKMFGDGAESFEKTITFSEIRHILRHFDQFCPEDGHQTVTFFRKGEPLSKEETQKLRQQFDERRTAARERKKLARTALAVLEKCDSPEALQLALQEHQKTLEAVAIGVIDYLRWLEDQGRSVTSLRQSQIAESLKSNVKARNSRIDKKLAMFGLPG